MTIRTKALGCAMIASVTLLAGCINTTPPTPSPTPTPSVTPTPTPSATPTPTLSAEQQAAATAVVKFYEVINQVATNDEVDLNSVYEVAGGEAAQVWLRDLQAMKVAGLIQTGLARPKIRSVEGLAEPFVVKTCVDTTEADVVDKQGKSVVGEGNLTRILYEYTVEHVGQTLRVTKGEAVSAEC